MNNLSNVLLGLLWTEAHSSVYLDRAGQKPTEHVHLDRAGQNGLSCGLWGSVGLCPELSRTKWFADAWRLYERPKCLEGTQLRRQKPLWMNMAKPLQQSWQLLALALRQPSLSRYGICTRHRMLVPTVRRMEVCFLASWNHATYWLGYREHKWLLHPSIKTLWGTQRGGRLSSAMGGDL